MVRVSVGQDTRRFPIEIYFNILFLMFFFFVFVRVCATVADLNEH